MYDANTISADQIETANARAVAFVGLDAVLAPNQNTQWLSSRGGTYDANTVGADQTVNAGAVCRRASNLHPLQSTVSNRRRRRQSPDDDIMDATSLNYRPNGARAVRHETLETSKLEFAEEDASDERIDAREQKWTSNSTPTRSATDAAQQSGTAQWLFVAINHKLKPTQ